MQQVSSLFIYPTPLSLIYFEKESNRSLPFVDVGMKKSNSQFITSVFRKPIFTDERVRWNCYLQQGTETYFYVCSQSLGHLLSIFLSSLTYEDSVNL